MIAPETSSLLEISFTQLLSNLQAIDESNSEVQKTLKDGKGEILRAIKFPYTQPDNVDSVYYRRNSSLSSRFPEPTKAELTFVSSVCQSLNISKPDAAILLRDFIEYSLDHSEDTLELCDDLSKVISMKDIEKFWIKERKAASSSLMLMIKRSSDSTNSPLQAACSQFMMEYKDSVKETVLNSTVSLLKVFGDIMQGTQQESALSFQPWWVLELLLCLSNNGLLEVTDVSKLLKEFAIVLKNYSSFRMPNSRCALDGGEASALFIATLCTFNNHSRMTTRQEGSSPEKKADVNHLNSLYQELQRHPSEEVSVLLFSWSSVVRLQSNESMEDLSDEFSDVGFEHMSHAVSHNVFESLDRISKADLMINDLVRGLLYKSFCNDVFAFLAAFPPQNFTLTQVEEIVHLVSSLLRPADDITKIELGESVWDAEDVGKFYSGPNTVIRLASSVFPQVFRPLISLLTELTVSKRTAAHATNFLENRLLTVTELSDNYRASITAVDEEEDRIWNALRHQFDSNIDIISKTFEMVRTGEGDSLFVQTIDEIPGAGYRQPLPAGTIGTTDDSLAVVTWISQWNGFGAMHHILQLLVQSLRHPEIDFSQDETALQELILSATASLHLIERIFTHGSETLKDYLSDRQVPIYSVSSLFSELVTSTESKKVAWLTKQRQASLLLAASSCLTSMTMQSSTRARAALDTIYSSLESVPVHVILGYLGKGAFPLLSSLTSMTIALTEAPYSSEELVRAFAGENEKGSFTYGLNRSDLNRSSYDKTTDILCSAGLPLWSSTLTRDIDTSSFGSTKWLLPACAMRLIAKNAIPLIHETAPANVFAEVINAAAAPTSDGGILDQDTFLFHALREALIACHETLKARHANLQNSTTPQMQVNDAHNGRASKRQSRDDYIPYEKAMLKPEVLHALATLSSGRGEKLRSTDFYGKWKTSVFRCYISDEEEYRYLFYSSNPTDIERMKVTSWRIWLADMSARCLSLSFSCFSKNPFHTDVIQVPWPTMHKSSSAYWRGGGDMICSGYTERISNEGSTAVIEMLTSILSNGQRAAARSLLSPHQEVKKSEKEVEKGKEEKENGSATKRKVEEVKVEKVEESEEHNGKSRVIQTIVECLEKNKIAFLEQETDARSALQLGQGHQSLVIAACVRFLRVGCDSHCSKWFQESWQELKVWEHLSELLRCEVSNSKSTKQVHLGTILDMQPYAHLITERFDIGHSSGKDTLRSIFSVTLSTDLASVWKALVSDTLQLFSMEIMYKSCEGLVELQSTKSSNSTEGEEVKLPVKLFQEPAFHQFADVFTERWMDVLLRNDFCYLSAKDVPLAISGNKNDDQEIGIAEVEMDPVSLEKRTRELSLYIASELGINNSSHGSFDNLLLRFRRRGDVRTRFGADYTFDVQALIEFLQKQELNRNALLQIARHMHALNTVITRQDGFAEVATAFSAITSSALFADSFAPSPSAALTYSSPQYPGKLCRFAAWILGRMRYSLSTSIHTMAVSAEISRLIASLSTQLSADELEQSALTALRFLNSSHTDMNDENCSSVQQMCIFTRAALTLIETGSVQHEKREIWADIVRWLLLTLSRLVIGSAYRNDEDVTTLTEIAITALNYGREFHTVCAAASVTLSSIFESGFGNSARLKFDLDALDIIFSSIAKLSQMVEEESERLHISETTASLLLMIGRVQAIGAVWGKKGEAVILQQLSGSSIQAFLQSGDTHMSAYKNNSENRHPSHLVWCACLQLASMTIPTKSNVPMRDTERETEVRNILEFCSTNLARIIPNSIDFSGDWPPQQKYTGEFNGNDSTNVGIQRPKHITMGRLEEAEVACSTIHKLSYFTQNLLETLPGALEQTVPQLVRLTSHTIRLLRAEPVERWVRPVTQRERERSYFIRSERETQILPQSLLMPWTRSPSNGGTPGSGTPPRRSPSQALRAAIGESSGRGPQTPASVSPSPGTSLTPAQFSPMLSSLTPGTFAKVMTPASPWGPYGSGLITASSLSFGEEASRSLLRTLAIALAALQRFCEETGALVYGQSMQSAEEIPGIGVLITIQSYAASEMHRGADGERREYLQAIADNALHLSIIHVIGYMDQGSLPQSSIDEFRKRLGTIISRARRLVPPPPSGSLYLSKELDSFYALLR